MASGNKRWDVCTPRPKHPSGTWWLRVGSAVENNGRVMVYLDAVPLPDKERGNIVLALFEPREKGETETKDAAGAKTGRTTAKSAPSKELDDDEIPF